MWASVLTSLADRLVFFVQNSLDARLVSRTLDLCFACRFFVHHDGTCDVFDALCAGDGLLTAALDAADVAGGVGIEDLRCVAMEKADGLDAALRVLELCSLRAEDTSERGIRDAQREGGLAPRARAVEFLRDFLSSGEDARERDLCTAAIALANSAPTRRGDGFAPRPSDHPLGTPRRGRDPALGRRARDDSMVARRRRALTS